MALMSCDQGLVALQRTLLGVFYLFGGIMLATLSVLTGLLCRVVYCRQDLLGERHACINFDGLGRSIGNTMGGACPVHPN